MDPNEPHPTNIKFMSESIEEIRKLNNAGAEAWPRDAKFFWHNRVRKKKGSWWEGIVVGWYKTQATTIGYCVQLDIPQGPVQIYPEDALAICPSPERTFPISKEDIISQNWPYRATNFQAQADVMQRSMDKALITGERIDPTSEWPDDPELWGDK